MNVDTFLWIILLCIMSIFLGCQPKPEYSPPYEFDCTTEQMKLVDDQTASCNKNTSWPGAACYGWSMERNCKRKAK